MTSLFLGNLAEHEALMRALPALDGAIADAGRKLAALLAGGR
jgi:hypothetical protein